jgi:hypothetical protein
VSFRESPYVVVYHHAVLARLTLETYLAYARSLARRLDLLERRLLERPESGSWDWCRDARRATRARWGAEAAELLEERPLVDAAVERAAVAYELELAAVRDVLRQIDGTGRMHRWAREELRT